MVHWEQKIGMAQSSRPGSDGPAQLARSRGLEIPRGRFQCPLNWLTIEMTWSSKLYPGRCELAKRDPTCVAEFLDKEKTRLAAHVRREVRTKLETGCKIRRQ